MNCYERSAKSDDGDEDHAPHYGVQSRHKSRYDDKSSVLRLRSDQH